MKELLSCLPLISQLVNEESTPTSVVWMLVPPCPPTHPTSLPLFPMTPRLPCLLSGLEIEGLKIASAMQVNVNVSLTH